MDRERSVPSHFFKVMMPGFRTTLPIPPAFSRHLEVEKSKEAIISSRKGLWHVRIVKCDKGKIWFGEGWSKFVQHHDLNIADFLVFEHKGLMHFDVLIFGPSACEKEFPIRLEDAKQTSPVEVKIQKHAKKEGQNPLDEAASFSSRKPYFKTTINASHGIGAYLTIPVEFVKANDLAGRCSVTLRDPSRNLWPVKLCCRKGCKKNSKYLLMGSDWSAFYESSKLKKGDICIFELNWATRKSGNVLMDVHIFRVPI